MAGITDDMQGLAAKLVQPLRAWFLGYGAGYQEGLWSPTIGGTGGNPTGVVYSVQGGTYTRIGRLVTCWGRIALSAVGAPGAGAIVIGGLPFLSLNDANLLGSVAVSFVSNLGYAAGIVQLVGYVDGNSTQAILVETQDNAPPNATGAARLAAGDDLVFQMTYPAAIV